MKQRSKTPALRPDKTRSTAPGAFQERPSLIPPGLDDQWEDAFATVVNVVRNLYPEADETLQPPQEVAPPAPLPAAAAKDPPDPEDSVRTFLLTCCVLGSTKKVKMGDLYTAYRIWCRTQGIPPQTLVKVGRRLDTLGFSKKPGRKTGVWRLGIALEA